MPLRPDIGDVIELVDDPDHDQHDKASTASHAAPEPPPSLAEQRARRRHRGGLARDVRKGVA